MISPAAIQSPRIVEGNLAYEQCAYLATDPVNPRVEVEVIAINEYRARVAGGIALNAPAWRVRVRPAIKSLKLA